MEPFSFTSLFCSVAGGMTKFNCRSCWQVLLTFKWLWVRVSSFGFKAMSAEPSCFGSRLWGLFWRCGRYPCSVGLISGCSGCFLGSFDPLKINHAVIIGCNYDRCRDILYGVFLDLLLGVMLIYWISVGCWCLAIRDILCGCLSGLLLPFWE